MPPAGFEPAIPAGDRLQTHALDRSVTGICNTYINTKRQISLDGYYTYRTLGKQPVMAQLPDKIETG